MLLSGVKKLFDGAVMVSSRIFKAVLADARGTQTELSVVRTLSKFSVPHDGLSPESADIV